ncbi:MAG TPA: hypothetical protein DCS67_10585 [Clostridiales bacterium UBA8960]|nr:hypothetical protein [Clostridiales bacterium UBA8960]
MSRHEFSVRDKALIILAILLVIVLAVKSNFYDAYKPDVGEDITVIENFISQVYDGPIYESGLLKVRLIKYIESDGVFTLKLRRYFVGIFPIGEIYRDLDQ